MRHEGSQGMHVGAEGKYALGQEAMHEKFSKNFVEKQDVHLVGESTQSLHEGSQGVQLPNEGSVPLGHEF